MREIALTQGKKTLVDENDYEQLSGYRWCAWNNGRGRWYAVTRVATGLDSPRQRNLYLHRLLMKATKQQVDHVNGDGLDNRRVNLRLCTTAQNAANRGRREGTSSKYKGVCWAGDSVGKWKASVRENGKRKHLGYFTSQNEAAIAYNRAARVLHGEFARLNEVQKD